MLAWLAFPVVALYGPVLRRLKCLWEHNGQKMIQDFFDHSLLFRMLVSIRRNGDYWSEIFNSAGHGNLYRYLSENGEYMCHYVM